MFRLRCSPQFTHIPCYWLCIWGVVVDCRIETKETSSDTLRIFALKHQMNMYPTILLASKFLVLINIGTRNNKVLNGDGRGPSTVSHGHPSTLSASQRSGGHVLASTGQGRKVSTLTCLYAMWSSRVTDHSYYEFACTIPWSAYFRPGMSHLSYSPSGRG
jgi:hypothetical protein